MSIRIIHELIKPQALNDILPAQRGRLIRKGEEVSLPAFACEFDKSRLSPCSSHYEGPKLLPRQVGYVDVDVSTPSRSSEGTKALPLDILEQITDIITDLIKGCRKGRYEFCSADRFFGVLDPSPRNVWLCHLVTVIVLVIVLFTKVQTLGFNL